jgi:hypothetical protein
MVTSQTGRPTAIEKRFGLRRLASQVPSIAGLRLFPYGANATLVNISTSGLLAECTVGLKAGSLVTVLFEGGFSPESIACRVVRCAVSAVGQGRLCYHVGIAFNATIAPDLTLERSAQAEKPPRFADSNVSLPVSTPAPPVARNRW